MNLSEIMNSALAVGAILGGVAYALGQWMSARKRGSSDALRIAVEEVNAIKIRVERIEKENIDLHIELASLKKENKLLRDLLTVQDAAQQRVMHKLEDLFNKQTRRLVDVMREGKEKTE